MKKKLKKIIAATKYFVEHNYSRTSVAKEFNVDKKSIAIALEDYFLYTIDVNDEYLYYFEAKELELINYFFNNPNASYQEACRFCNIYPKLDTFKHWCKILNLEYQRHYKVNFNRDVFHEIDTEEKAYWLGFILADGYINEDQNMLVINLSEKDEKHLYKFLNFIGMPITEQKDFIKSGIGGAYTQDNITKRITLCSKELILDLKDKNIFQAKSGKEVPYYDIKHELLFHYIRGIFDGDGSIRSTQEGIKIVNSQEVCTFIRNIFINKFNWSSDNYNKYLHSKGSIYAFEISNQTKDKQILDAIYKDATIFLERKFKLYQDKYCRV